MEPSSQMETVRVVGINQVKLFSCMKGSTLVVAWNAKLFQLLDIDFCMFQPRVSRGAFVTCRWRNEQRGP